MYQKYLSKFQLFLNIKKIIKFIKMNFSGMAMSGKSIMKNNKITTKGTVRYLAPELLQPDLLSGVSMCNFLCKLLNFNILYNRIIQYIGLLDWTFIQCHSSFGKS